MKTNQPGSAGEAFAGFSAGTFQFLRELADNQTRDWFQAHKGEYEAHVREPMARLVAELGSELLRRGFPFQSDPKRSVFRINRDIRFSNDKRPYKTHISAAITREGEKMSPGVLYIHVDPEGSFAAAGFFRPEADALRAIRNGIASRPEEFRRVLQELKGKKLKLSADEDALKRAPRNFEHVREGDVLDVLRQTSFIVERPLSQKLLRGPGLKEELAGFAEAARSLLHFGWKAMDG